MEDSIETRCMRFGYDHVTSSEIVFVWKVRKLPNSTENCVVGAYPCIVVSTAAVAKELFQNNDAIFASRPLMSFWTTKFKGSTDYRSLVGAPYGSYWRQLRRLCVNELFSPMRHAFYKKVRIEEVHDMMKLVLKNSSKGHTVNLLNHLHGVAANNSTRMITNKRYVLYYTLQPRWSWRLSCVRWRLFSLHPLLVGYETHHN